MYCKGPCLYDVSPPPCPNLLTIYSIRFTQTPSHPLLLEIRPLPNPTVEVMLVSSPNPKILYYTHNPNPAHQVCMNIVLSNSKIRSSDLTLLSVGGGSSAPVGGAKIDSCQTWCWRRGSTAAGRRRRPCPTGWRIRRGGGSRFWCSSTPSRNFLKDLHVGLFSTCC